jgi:uncharacterized protein (DUF1501 family)
MKQLRRKFLIDSACGLTAAAMISSLERLNLVNAMVQQQQPEVAGDYRALVCIFLFGGSDANNMVIPYTQYSDAGGYGDTRTASGLGVSKSAILQITPSNMGGNIFGLHPNLSPEVANPTQTFKGLLDVWNAGKLAVLCNYGSLIQPITRAQYQANTARPYQLFSHSDQQTQQQTIVPNGVGQTGWAGRIADTSGGLNGSVPLPMNVSIAGSQIFCTGRNTRQMVIADSNTPLNNVLALNWSGPAGANPGTANSSYQQLLGFDLDASLVKATSDTTTQALTTRAALSANPTLMTTFPIGTSIGRQLFQAARLINLRGSLGMKRQVFFCSLGGFDTHTNETGADPTNPAGGAGASGNQGGLLTQLSQAMRAFYDEMNAQGLSNNVTTFTLSDFSRTFQPSGSGAGSVGTDHAWGSHAFIMGGSVLGGRFYGTFPTLALNGPDDTDNRGRWIPTTSVDQYAATLAAWYGLASSDLPTVFPNLSRFSSSNLGFMGP